MGSSVEQLAKALLQREGGGELEMPQELGLEPPSSEADALRRPRLERPPVALRYVPSLHVPQQTLVGFISEGYGFNDRSVSEAVAQANAHFAARELQEAIDVYGAAYELGRLNYDYRPLMHDVLLRRVLCHSMRGYFAEALRECEMALKIIPNGATANLLRGLLYSKLGNSDAANDAFQRAVTQNRDLRDVIDCLIALFTLGENQNDRAIQICNRILDRCRHPFALLIRGDAYKFHVSGYFTEKATSDYAAVLDCDMGAQGFIGEKFTKELHARADELLLRFHPRLLAEGPRPYSKYPLYGKTHPFFVVALVLFACGKLRAWARSTKLVHDVEMQNEEMLRERAAAEHRMLKLFEAQRKIAGNEGHAEVWGPANPDLRVRRYRRYWMERPICFPRRGDAPYEDGPRGSPRPDADGQEEGDSMPYDVQQKGACGARDELFDRMDQDRDGVISREEFNRFVLEANAPVPVPTLLPPAPLRGAAVEAAAALARREAGESAEDVLWPSGGLAARLKAAAEADDAKPQVGTPVAQRPKAATPSTTPGGATRAPSPASASVGELPTPRAPTPDAPTPHVGALGAEEPAGPETPAGSRAEGPLELLDTSGGVPGMKGAVENLLEGKQRVSVLAAGDARASAAAGKPGSAVTEALQVAAKLAKEVPPSIAAATPPKLKTGHDWSEEQWIERAVQMAEQFRTGLPGPDAKGGKGAKPPSGDAASFGRPSPKPPLIPDPLVPATSTLVMLPVAGPPGRTTSNVSNCGTPMRRDSLDPSPSVASTRKDSLDPCESHASSDEPCMPDDEPGFVGVYRPGLPPGLKVPLNLVEAIEEYGFDVLPDWYTALDKVYEITEMAPYTAEAESVVPVPGLTGAPGFSYVVPKSPMPAERSVVPPPLSATKPSEAAAKRYSSRLVATRPPGPRGTSQPAPGGRGPPKCGVPVTKKVDLPPSVAAIDLEGSPWEPPRYQLQGKLEAV